MFGKRRQSCARCCAVCSVQHRKTAPPLLAEAQFFVWLYYDVVLILEKKQREVLTKQENNGIIFPSRREERGVFRNHNVNGRQDRSLEDGKVMDAKVAELLNEQINKEFYSAYLYLDMANFYRSKGLDGFSNWFEIQAKEEQDHAILIYQYLHNNSCPVVLEAVAKPDKVYDTLNDPLKAALQHEKYVTALIHHIYEAAQAVNDYRTLQFLDWFVKEQGEEEKNSSDLITKMELFGDDARSLYMLNSELAGRTYTAPSLEL